jgi:hypothetical protein
LVLQGGGAAAVSNDALPADSEHQVGLPLYRLTVLNLFGDPRVVKLQQMMKNLQQMQYQEMLSKRHRNQHSTHRMQSKQTPSKQLQIYRSAKKYLVTLYNVAFL